MSDSPPAPGAPEPPRDARRQADDVPAGYHVLKLLGRGGQGVVWEAIQSSTGRRVALKLLALGAAASERQHQRLLREVQLATNLQHPALAGVVHAGTTPSGAPFLAMELVRGARLDDWADATRETRGEAALDDVLRVVAELCAAVGHAHARGVVHRDLKPSNVLVDADGHPRVLDLGLARWIEEAREDGEPDVFLTTTGEVLGSLAWMAPEALAGQRPARLQSDVYALGLLLHRAVTGRHAYPLGASVAEIVHGTSSLPERLAPPFASSPRLDRGLHAVLARALQRDPARRYDDAGAMARDLEALRAGASLRRPWTRRRSATVAGGILLALSLVVGIGERGGAAADLERRLAEAADRAELKGLDAHRAFESLLQELRDAPQLAGRDDATLDALRLQTSWIRSAYPEVTRAELPPDIAWTALVSGTDSEWLVARAANGRWARIRCTDDTLHGVEQPPLEASIVELQLSSDGRWLWMLTEDETHPATSHMLHLEGFSVLSHETWSERSFLSFARAHPWWIEWDERREELVVREADSGRELDAWAWPDDAPHDALWLDDDTLLQLSWGERRHALFRYPERSPVDVRGGRLAGLTRALPNGGLATWDLELTTLDPATGASFEILRSTVTPYVALGADGVLHAAVNGQVRRFHERHKRSGIPSAWETDVPWDLPGRVLGLCDLAGGTRLVALVEPGTLVLFEPRSDEFPRPLRAPTVRNTWLDLEPLPDAAGWLTCTDRCLVEFRGDAVRELEVADEGEMVVGLALAGTQRAYFSTNRGRVGALDLGAVGPCSPTWLATFDEEVGALAVSPTDGRLCAADRLGHCEVFAPDERAQGWRFREPDGRRIAELAWSPDGELVALASRAGRILWAHPAERRWTSSAGSMGGTRCLAFHPSEPLLVSGHDGGTLEVWELGAERPHESLVASPSSADSPWALQFSPDGRFLAVGVGRELAVWDWPARRRVFASRVHDGMIFAVAFLPGTTQLASAAEESELFVWDFRYGDALLEHGH